MNQQFKGTGAYTQEPETGVFCGLLGGNKLEMVKRRKVEWGGKVEDFVPKTTDSQDEDRPASRSESAAQRSDPNATALSIYRGVTYTNTTDEEGKSNTAHFLNPKNTNHRRRSTSKGDVIARCLSVHVFTVKEL